MPSERVQRHIDRLLDEADEAVRLKDWGQVRENAHAILDLDPENADARGFLEAAERALSRGVSTSPDSEAPARREAASPAASQPTSFCDGRYTVTRFLGEGGKK